MTSFDRLLGLLDLDTRGGRATFGLVLVLAVAIALSFVTNPSPLLQAAIGVALLALIVLRTLLAMGIRFRR